MASTRLFILTHALLFYLVASVLAEPVQYCRYGHANGEVDFCMGVTTHHNRSSNAYDLYLRLRVTRSSHLGWTAVGTGLTMAGSLMFIVYGDPRSGAGPILSIRSADGHHQPRLVTRSTMGGADLRVLRADWMPVDPNLHDGHPAPAPHQRTYVAELAAVCFACSRWPGSPVDAASSSQPWIWAWNDKQEISVYSFDAPLDMHRHHAGNGGWGTFFVDTARSASEDVHRPSLPPLRPGVAALGVSDAPIGAAGLVASIKARPLVHAHSIAMGVVFLLLFPLGVAAMRSGSSRAFRLHWVLQLAASLLVVAGVVLGVVLSRGRAFVLAHQWAGVAIALALGLQGLLGWRHHMVFLRIKRRTWVSHAHIWLGRLVILGGWGNMLSGLTLSGHGHAGIALGGLMVLEALVVTAWIWFVKLRLNRTAAAGMNAEPRAEIGAYFSLEDSDNEDEYEDEKLDAAEEGAQGGSMPRKSMAVER